MSETTLDQVITQRRDARRDIIDVDVPLVKLVIFELGRDWFAFHGDCIKEILARAEVFFVPGCPPSLEGVINVRGDIESVIRLHSLLQLPESPAVANSFVLLGRGAGMLSGIRVDRVVDVVDVLQSEIQLPPATVAEALRAAVSGVLRFQQRPVTVLNLDALFADYARGLG